MEEEFSMFIMSMSNSMSSLWPAPIEMDSIDEGTENVANIASRWSTCCNIIRLHIEQMIGCEVDVAVAKSTDLGVSMTRGNSDSKLEPISTLLSTISKTIESNGEANAEFAIREIEKMNKSCETEYKIKKFHWFIDVEMFLNIKLALLDREFPPNLTVYVIGELKTLYDDYEAAKEVATNFERSSVNLRFLLCPADLKELNREIIAEKRQKMSEKEIICRFGSDKFKIKLFKKQKIGSHVTLIDSISFLGFLPEIELCRQGFLGSKRSNKLKMDITTDSKLGNKILFSLSQYLLNETKRPQTALFSFSSKPKLRGFCIMVAYESENDETSITLIQLKASLGKCLWKTLKFVNQSGEHSRPLPDDSYEQIAPIERKQLKRRLSRIERIASSVEEKRAQFEAFAREYDALDARDAFMKFTSTWQTDQGLLTAPTPFEDDNNNK
ncbi:uncharacterized protein CELE_Y47G6A.25 [Caenorhabditis elegans]|uniref:Uncharacterized protein n=1 Tax=Caenorhabditis elegans TaxID=6239 RepID=Q9N3R6_CAEEL|nr:Uncharacterized protein CELE_Y47G6A.25 [Caenorhabditis elegans]CCD72570.1 Uncharacterized protein CELE_Y47G6A.25 [Caenorhabditis elegans]|eukprot:NP_491185.2 Uncharacterized protein CELE_Y47G6A.25 [Caenorhabditis elegans]